MTYDEAIAFWSARTNYEVRAAAPDDLKLERMRALLRRLGDPHARLRTVHVTGTKGKGSTAAMLAAVLRAAGHRVGLFTSPHLTAVEERTQVDGVPITRGELAARLAEVAAACAELEAAGVPPPTFFEIGTAVGFLHFLHRRVDVAVVEVGLGGRFDSTNVVRPLVSVVTSVGLDHTAQLGTTVEAIAYQKAGIIKPGVPVVSGVAEPGPAGVVARVAAELRAPLRVLGTDFGFAYRPGRPPRVSVRVGPTTSADLRLGLFGRHQAHNAALAVAAVADLRAAGLSVPDAAVASGLAGVEWPARVEVVSERPAVVIDSAHNVPSAEALVGTLAELFPDARGKRVVFAVSADKPFADILRVLAGYFDHFDLCRYGQNPRAAAPGELARVLAGRGRGTWAAHSSAEAAWAAGVLATGPDDLLCVTGSVFLAGELRPLALTRPGRI